jgi:hypothetical protein
MTRGRTWGDRVDELWSDDFEVLHWVVERFERNGHSVEIGEALRVFPEEHYDSVREALRRLSRHTYLVAVNGSGPELGGRPATPVVTESPGARRAVSVGGPTTPNCWPPLLSPGPPAPPGPGRPPRHDRPDPP